MVVVESSAEVGPSRNSSALTQDLYTPGSTWLDVSANDLELPILLSISVVPGLGHKSAHQVYLALG